MIHSIETIFGLLGAVAALVLLARKIRVAYPILFVIGDLVLGFTHGLPRVRLEPELVFLLFFPPLLYPAAVERFSSQRPTDWHAGRSPGNPFNRRHCLCRTQANGSALGCRVCS